MSVQDAESVACNRCGHEEPHSAGGIGVCRHEGCGCDDLGLVSPAHEHSCRFFGKPGAAVYAPGALVGCTCGTDVDVLSVSQAHELFEERCRAWLGMSRVDFISRLESGMFDGHEEDPGVRELLALLPFALASESAW